MYFVQDYEPYFYMFGEAFIIAQKTYELGFHMISLGAWNKHMVERECSIISPIDVITFPYEEKNIMIKVEILMSILIKRIQYGCLC